MLVTICFDGLPTRYAYTLMVPQNITEVVLLGRPVRNAVIRVIGRIPAVRRWLATELAELRNR